MWETGGCRRDSRVCPVFSSVWAILCLASNRTPTSFDRLDYHSSSSHLVIPTWLRPLSHSFVPQRQRSFSFYLTRTYSTREESFVLFSRSTIHAAPQSHPWPCRSTYPTSLVPSSSRYTSYFFYCNSSSRLDIHYHRVTGRNSVNNPHPAPPYLVTV